MSARRHTVKQFSMSDTEENYSLVSISDAYFDNVGMVLGFGDVLVWYVFYILQVLKFKK